MRMRTVTAATEFKRPRGPAPAAPAVSPSAPSTVGPETKLTSNSPHSNGSSLSNASGVFSWRFAFPKYTHEMPSAMQSCFRAIDEIVTKPSGKTGSSTTPSGLEFVRKVTAPGKGPDRRKGHVKKSLQKKRLSFGLPSRISASSRNDTYKHLSPSTCKDEAIHASGAPSSFLLLVGLKDFDLFGKTNKELICFLLVASCY